MALKVHIDKQGRLVIPAKYRKKLSITEETPLEIKLVANQLVIRKVGSLKEKDLEKWKETIKEFDLTSKIDDRSEFSEKWMSEDYARDKLGL